MLVPRRQSGAVRAGLASTTGSAVSSAVDETPPPRIPVTRPGNPRRRGEPHAGGAHGSSQELRLPLVLDPGARWRTSSAGAAARRFRPRFSNARTQFFGQLQAPGKAKLILIRGEGVEGLSYQLNAEQHIVGRNGQLVFPDDPFVSPRHANLFYRNGKLVVRDEGSLNGVFVRVRGTVEVIAGRSLPRRRAALPLEATPKANDGPAPDGTYFYSSPKHQSPFRITQVLQGGAPAWRSAPAGRPADRARGGRPELPRRPLHERVALQDRGAGGEVRAHRPEQPQRHVHPAEGGARARARRLPLHRRKLLRVEITAA